MIAAKPRELGRVCVNLRATFGKHNARRNGERAAIAILKHKHTHTHTFLHARVSDGIYANSADVGGIRTVGRQPPVQRIVWIIMYSLRIVHFVCVKHFCRTI